MKEPDWKLAYSLYLQRSPLSVIVKEAAVNMAALKKRIQRGWRVERMRSGEIAGVDGREKLQSKSEIIKHAIADEVINDLDVVREKPSRNLKDVERKQNVLHTIAGTAEKVCSWSGNGAPSTLVSIASLQALQVVNSPRQSKSDDVFVYFDSEGKPHECGYEEFIRHHPESEKLYLPPQPVIDVTPEPNGHVPLTLNPLNP